jgi:hypothetical protein
MSYWISVDDRLPESGKRVIFTWMTNYNPPKRRTSIGFYAERYYIDADHWEFGAEYDSCQDGYYAPEGWYEEAWELDDLGFVEGATHWMPIPELSK